MLQVYIVLEIWICGSYLISQDSDNDLTSSLTIERLDIWTLIERVGQQDVNYCDELWGNIYLFYTWNLVWCTRRNWNFCKLYYSWKHFDMRSKGWRGQKVVANSEWFPVGRVLVAPSLRPRPPGIEPSPSGLVSDMMPLSYRLTLDRAAQNSGSDI